MYCNKIFVDLKRALNQQRNFLFKLLQLLLILVVQIHSAEPQQFLTPADFQLALKEEEVTFLTELDFDNARKFKNLFALDKAKRNILTQQPFYRGDIQGKAAWRRERRPWRRRLGTSTSRRFNGVANVVKKWPNGRIPYVLSLEYSERERAILARAFEEYHGRTCIRFVPKTPFDHDYLFIGKIDGCYSDVGRAGGKQELSLDNGCLHLDTVIHELVRGGNLGRMHSVGFYHEHERWDRDKYLMILWQNIDKDYHSIMHYDSLAFSKNGLETLMTREPKMTKLIGAAIDFSPIDLAKIHRMYRCPAPEIEPKPADIEFIGDNSIARTIPVQEIVTPLFRMPFSLRAGTANFESIERRSTKPNPAVPLYLRVNSPILREQQPPKMDQYQPRKMGCEDRTNLCGFWLPYCRSDPHKRIMQELCQRTCNFCRSLSKSLTTTMR
uniref:Metalloendopeptidase n=1 Tax=Globodera rostochiensis TaxID=31243 RepID=A0A914HU06_GLORO